MIFNGVSIGTCDSVAVGSSVKRHNEKMKDFSYLKKGKQYNMYVRENGSFKLKKAFMSTWSELEFVYMNEYSLFFKNNINRYTCIPRNNTMYRFKEYNGGDTRCQKK